MKIISLTAENVKRLKAVYIEPDGTLQVVTGRNAQGKTSVLDAIWLALGGGAAMRDTAKPIREGEEKASVVLDLGDLIVTRTWKGDSTALDVRGKDGTRYTSPQTMLDALDAKRDASLAAAKFPVDGLGFTDDGVTFKGVPFGQASSAEQITVSLAMAMALNPKLRVIRILDGSLLDPDSMQTIAAMAGENDYQVWVERVSDTSGVGVVIEDGEVQS